IRTRISHLPDITGEISIPEGIPELFYYASASGSKRSRETSATVPSKRIVRADCDGLPITFVVSPFTSSKIGFARGIRTASDYQRARILSGHLIRCRNRIEDRYPLLSSVVCNCESDVREQRAYQDGCA